MFKRMTCPSYLFQNSISLTLKCFQTYSLFQKLTCQSYAQDLTKFRHFFAGFEVPRLKSSRYSTLLSKQVPTQVLVLCRKLSTQNTYYRCKQYIQNTESGQHFQRRSNAAVSHAFTLVSLSRFSKSYHLERISLCIQEYKWMDVPSCKRVQKLTCIGMYP